ncbi:MFS transporter [Demequina sediminicola]|uniref:MFS transporter n=1 Tax=Demequina sediminicola TaxID=1095026 RepID=UPI0007839287|nr:MFS transporter [Demequina sediminicola]
MTEVPAPTSITSKVAVLASSQLIAGTGVAAGVSVGGLLAEDIAGTAAFSGLPQTGMVLGSALAAVPLARLAGRAGRRRALSLGYAIASIGAGLALASALTRSLPLLVVASLVVGAGMAAGLQARFAATDGVPDARRGLVLSVVVWASSIGAILGPNLLEPGSRLGESLAGAPLGGPWLFAIIALALATVVIAVGLRTPVPATVPPKRKIRDTVRVVWANPAGRLSLVGMASGHAVMVGVMVMTSVHLHGHGSSLTFVGIVISAHVAGMYILAPLFGWLSDRWGARAVVALGVVGLVIACGFTASSGWVTRSGGSHHTAEMLATVGLVLLGLGWSAVTVACATMIAVVSHHADAAPTDIQGVADLVMGLAGATAGLLSGVVLANAGYVGLSLAGIVVLIPLIWVLVRYAREVATAAE